MSRMFSQAKTLSDEEEKTMAKYDLSQFLYPFKKLKGDFSYLHKVQAPEHLSTLFDLIITFLLSCQRPHHI